MPASLLSTSVRGAAAAAALTAVLSLLTTLVVVPLVVQLVVPPDVVELTPELTAQVLGLSVIIGSPQRVAAGALAAALVRRHRGTDRRVEALPAAVVGVGAAWAVCAALALAGAALVDRDLGPLVLRQLLELLRWLVEGAVGALLVPPGAALAARRRARAGAVVR